MTEKSKIFGNETLTIAASSETDCVSIWVDTNEITHATSLILDVGIDTKGKSFFRRGEISFPAVTGKEETDLIIEQEIRLCSTLKWLSIRSAQFPSDDVSCESKVGLDSPSCNHCTP